MKKAELAAAKGLVVAACAAGAGAALAGDISNQDIAQELTFTSVKRLSWPRQGNRIVRLWGTSLPLRG